MWLGSSLLADARRPRRSHAATPGTLPLVQAYADEPRRRFLATDPHLEGVPAHQVNLAYLGSAPGWSVCVRRSFALDASGTPGSGDASLLVRGPTGGHPPHLLPTDVGAALFAAGTRKVFLTEWTIPGGWALRVYRLALEGLVLAVGPASGPVPSWCRREVTDDPAFGDEALAAAPAAPGRAHTPA